MELAPAATVLGAAAARLTELNKVAHQGDRQKLWTAALEMRLGQLAAERVRREAAAEAIMEAKQRELERLLEGEQGAAAQQGGQQAGPGGAAVDAVLPSPLASPVSRTG